MNVYFISGLTANCSVFDRIKLPDGYEKKYIEWIIPSDNETIERYTERMAETIDTSKPFILIGYSFGGIIIQEMSRFLKPEKKIIISSIKSEKEAPPLFRLGKRIHFAERFPMTLVSKDSILSDLFVRLVYHIPPNVTNKIVEYTDPVYLKWCIQQILDWKPKEIYDDLYHIHGTKDLTFPHKYISKIITVENGDHLMVMKKNREINKILNDILSGK